MKHLALSLPALALLAACGSNTDTTTTVTNTGTLTDIVTQTGNGAQASELDNATVALPVMTGQQFADASAASDAYEIEAGKLAQQKGTAQRIKDFGAMMVRNHTESTAKLKSAAGSASPAIVPNAKLTPELEANLAKLRSATREDFDTEYRTQQIMAHQTALATLEGYQASGDVQQLKDWAGEIVPVVRNHLDQIQGM
jgi:putative membrane protein